MAERIYGAQQGIHNSAPTPPQEPKLNRVHEHLSTEGSQFAEIATRISNLADRLLGGQPSPVAKESARGLPGSSLARLESACEDLSNLRNSIAADLTRLEAL